MPFVKSEIVIKGEKQKIFDVIQDMASYPKFMNVDGRKIVWTERDDFYPETFKITYKQTAGDLKKMEGAWELFDTEEGVNVSLAVDFEFGIPMIAGLLNPILIRKVRENSEDMLQAIKGEIEK